MSKLVVIHDPQYAAIQQERDVRVISFEELKKWVKSGKIFSHLFHYSESRLLTHDFHVITKPFVLSLILRILSRKQSFLQDSKKIHQKISIPFLFSLLIRMLKDSLKKTAFLSDIQKEVDSLSHPLVSKKEVDLSRQPVYLRTDFYFGVKSGGSIGHIAGVLNHLMHFTGNPIFLSSDWIPTVHSEWESHIISPGRHFWDFSQIPSFYYNALFFQEAIQKIGNRIPAFIYQRHSLNNFSGIKLAKHYRVPFILEFNGSEIWVSKNWGNGLKYESLSKKIEHSNLMAANLITVVSNPLKQELIAQGIDPQKILVNPNAVDPSRYSPSVDGSQVRKKYALEGKIVLGFIGTFGLWHGAEILAEAYGKLLTQFPEFKEKTRLLMVGDGATMSLVKSALSKWDVSQFCTLTGIVAQEEGPAYLAACDIFLSPHVPNNDGSAFFGSPTKLFEYMAMGKGIVASNLEQIGEILEHNRTAWLVTPNDIHSLVVGMKTLIEDHHLRARLGQEARKEAIAKHTWKEHVRKIVEKIAL